MARLNGQQDAEVEARQGSERATELSVELNDARACPWDRGELARAKGELKRTEVTKERAEAEKRRAQDSSLACRPQRTACGSLAQAALLRRRPKVSRNESGSSSTALSARDDAVGRVTVLEAEVMRLSIECNEAMDAKGERARALVEQQALQADLHLANQASEC